MKKIFVLLLFLALAYADTNKDFTPDWHSCSAPLDIWEPISVVFDQEPKAGKAITTHICGTVKDTTIPANFVLQAKQNIGGTFITTMSTVIVVDQNKITQGQQYCLQYTADIPLDVSSTFLIDIEPHDTQDAHLGCVELTVNF